jgi:peptidoglycan/xylan/chitin deacetylase (PgdA/CDA1 family)
MRNPQPITPHLDLERESTDQTVAVERDLDPHGPFGAVVTPPGCQPRRREKWARARARSDEGIPFVRPICQPRPVGYRLEPNLVRATVIPGTRPGQGLLRHESSLPRHPVIGGSMRWATRLGLTYHAITDSWDNELAVRPASFQAQLRAVAEAGYRGVTFSHFAAEPAKGTVAVTFDDGFCSVYEQAAPVLEELGWPATVFVTTGAVERAEPMHWLLAAGRPKPREPDELRPLTWSQLESLASRGWEVGSHSASHRLLSGLGAEERHEELASSRSAVAEHAGSCTSVSYPWGEVNDVVVAAARRAGFKAGGGLAGRFHMSDPFRVPRFAVARHDDGVRIALKTSAPVWTMRRSPLWAVVSRVRHPNGVGPGAST